METAHRALRQVERLVAPGVICDVGCWTGSFLVAAEERGWRAVGIEPSAWASERARQRGIDARCAELDGAELDAGSCSLVVMGDVLEHLLDPGKALAAAARQLKPRGLVYITVPDAGSPLARIMGRRWWSVLPMHVQYFTRRSMTRLLQAQGFEVVSMGSHAKMFSAGYYAERIGGYHPALEALTLAALRRLKLESRLVAPDFHDRIAVIAARRDVQDAA